MSLNRFESTAPLLYAKPGDLASIRSMPPHAVTVVLDILDDWTTETVLPAVDDAVARGGLTLFLRIGIPDDISGQDALERLVALRPEGFVLAGCSQVADIQKLDVMLRIAEAECGIAAGVLRIVAEVGADPAFFLSPRSLNGVSQRLQSIVFDAGALTRATGSQAVHAADGRLGAPLIFARAAVVLKAREAGLSCHELPANDDLSDDNLSTAQDAALADGFLGIAARNAAQLRAILSVR